MNKLLKVIYSLHFLNDGFKTVIIVLLPFIAKDLHLSLTQVGFLGASQGVFAALLAAPMGILISKIGGIKIIFGSLFLYSLCAFGIGISPNIIFLFILFYLAGAGFAPFHIVGQSLTARISGKNNLGRNMGTFTSTGESGRVLLPTIALFITTYIGWRFTYIGFALSGLALFAFVLWMVRNDKHIFVHKKITEHAESSKDWLKQMLIMLRQKKLVLVTLAGALDNLGGNAVFIFLPFLLLAKQVPLNFLGFFMGAFFLGSLAGKTFLGRSVDRYGPARVFIVAELFMVLLLIILTTAQNIVLLFFLSFILGIFTRGTTPVISILFSKVSHESHYEKVYTICEIFLGIAATFSAILLGYTSDRFGITYAFYVSAFFAFTATVPVYLFAKSK